MPTCDNDILVILSVFKDGQLSQSKVEYRSFIHGIETFPESLESPLMISNQSLHVLVAFLLDSLGRYENIMHQTSCGKTKLSSFRRFRSVAIIISAQITKSKINIRALLC